MSQLEEREGKVKDWTDKAKTGNLLTNKRSVAELLTATLVQYEVWTRGVRSHDERI